MDTIRLPVARLTRRRNLLAVAAALAVLSGCASTAHSDRAARDLLRTKAAAQESPRALASRYSEALDAFGVLLETYRPEGKVLYVQTRTIADATGMSHPLVGSELPGDITEMMRTAINRIGSRVVYVPFQPDYVLAQAQQGARMRLTVPDVLITGAITEFDRALASAGKGNNLSFLFGGGRSETDMNAERKATSTLSDLTLDLNLVDFDRQVMLPKIQAANTIRLLNETYEHSFDFAITGQAFGLTSNTRYLQGRHSALRLLVDLSVLEVLGRYAMVPYWRCIPNAVPDPVVMERVERSYAALDRAGRIKWLRDTLKDYGVQVRRGKSMDDRLRQALDEVSVKHGIARRDDFLDPALFVDLYVAIPLQQHAAGRVRS